MWKSDNLQLKVLTCPDPLIIRLTTNFPFTTPDNMYYTSGLNSMDCPILLSTLHTTPRHEIPILFFFFFRFLRNIVARSN